MFVSIERRIGLTGHKYCDPLYSSGSEPREIFRRFVRGYLQIKDATKMGEPVVGGDEKSGVFKRQVSGGCKGRRS